MLPDSELRFRELLRQLALPQGENPIEILLAELRAADLHPSFDSGKLESQIIMFLTMDELGLLLAQKPEDFDPNIKNIIQLLRRENLKTFFARITTKLKVGKKMADEFKFSVPRGNFVLQKLGQSLKGVVLRDCYLTPDTFGQIKDKKSGTIVKPNYFKNQFVEVQLKKEVFEALRREKEGKRSGGRESFPWPDKKELAPFQFRVLFEERGKIPRSRAVYILNSADAASVRRNAVFRRVVANDANLKLKFLPLKAIWMIKSAEYFYRRHLQPFFRLEGLSDRLGQEAEQVRRFAREYARVYYPVQPTDPEPQPEPEAYQLYHFHDNSHMIFKPDLANALDQPSIDLEETRRQMATVIRPDLLGNTTLGDEPSFLQRQRTGVLASPFEELDRDRAYELKELEAILAAPAAARRVPNAGNPLVRPFIQLIVENSKFLVRVNKLIFPNFARLKDKVSDDSAFEDLLLGSELRAAGEGVVSKSGSFLNEIGVHFVAFEFRNSARVSYEGLQSLAFKIQDKVTGQVLFEGPLDLQALIDNVYLENPLFCELRVNVKGVALPAVLYCTVAFVPRNLETAHITLGRELIEANFVRFGEILKKSENYPDFRAAFYPPEYTEAKLQRFNFDLFFKLNNHLSNPNVLTNGQENLFAHSFVGDHPTPLPAVLRRFLAGQGDLAQLLRGIGLRLAAGEKVGALASLDLFTRVAELLGARERHFLHRTLFELTNRRFFGPGGAGLDGWQFQASAVYAVNQAIDEGVVSLGFLQPDERYLIYQVCFELYLLFENNAVNKKSYKIHFSKHWVPLVARLVQLNSFELGDEEILQVALSQIAAKHCLRSYTHLGQLTFQSSLLIFAKILFKNLFPEQYNTLTGFMVSLDALVSVLLMESLASLMDTVCFNVYQDFKAAFELALLLQELGQPRAPGKAKAKEPAAASGLLGKLKAVELSFSSLVDVLFVVNALAANVAQFEGLVEPERFTEWVRKVVAKEAYELKKNLPKLLELVEHLQSVDFYDSTFLFFKEIARQQHEERVVAFASLSANLKKLGVSASLVQEIITNEIANSPAFRSKAYSLFQLKEEPPAHNAWFKDVEDSTVTTRPGGPADLEHDIFFDIAEDFQTNHYKDLNPGQQKALRKYNSCLIFLNNLDVGLLDALVSTRELSANFNNIFDFEGEELAQFMKQYLRVPDAMRADFSRDLSAVCEGKRVALVQLLVIMIAGGLDDRNAAAAVLGQLADALTSVFFANQKSHHFNWVVTFLVDQLYSLTPSFYFADFANNLVNVADKSLMVYVRFAKINLRTEVVDVWDICTKHLMSFYQLNGRYGIAFNYEFCRDLTRVFNDLIKRGTLAPEFSKFELFLEVNKKGRPSHHLVPFRITFVPETGIICRDDGPLLFEERVTEENLISPRVLAESFLQSPLCYLTPPSAPRNGLGFLSVPFVFEFRATETFLRVELGFVEKRVERTCSNLVPWAYPKENLPALQKFAAPTLRLALSYSMFFLRIAELHRLLTIKVMEGLRGNDVFSFIKLNSEKFQLLTSKGKVIDPEYHFLDLKEFEKALKDKTPMQVCVKYN